MIQVKNFICNSFQVNSWLLYEDSGDAAIIDPGFCDQDEENEFISFLTANNLSLKYLINTHTHIDHILGNHFISANFKLNPLFHKNDLSIFKSAASYADIFGMNYTEIPVPVCFLTEDSVIQLGNNSIKVIFTPGHTPGHITLYAEKEQFVVCGDVLFYGSIGRTDLPGGNFEQLIESINQQLFILPDNTKVLCGHGNDTSIGYEKKNNPFVGINS